MPPPGIPRRGFPKGHALSSEAQVSKNGTGNGGVENDRTVKSPKNANQSKGTGSPLSRDGLRAGEAFGDGIESETDSSEDRKPRTTDWALPGLQRPTEAAKTSTSSASVFSPAEFFPSRDFGRDSRGSFYLHRKNYSVHSHPIFLKKKSLNYPPPLTGASPLSIPALAPVSFPPLIRRTPSPLPGTGAPSSPSRQRHNPLPSSPRHRLPGSDLLPTLRPTMEGDGAEGVAGGRRGGGRC